jgi:uncharacterized protein (UPF0128 family)
MDTWKLEIGPRVIRGEAHKVQQFLQKNLQCFGFGLKLGKLNG